MELKDYLQIALSLLGGGAAGAIITAIATTIRARKPKISSSIKVIPIFKLDDKSSLNARLAIGDLSYSNLSIVEVQLTNSSSKDFEEFEFGATFEQGDSCIYVESNGADRFHRGESKVSPIPGNGMNAVDLSLEPFNRGDSYIFKFYIVVEEHKTGLGEVRLGSRKAVRFFDAASRDGIISALVKGITSVNVGSVSVSFKRDA